MKRAITLVLLGISVLAGCAKDGEKGDKGDTGVPGTSSTLNLYTGSINSDSEVITLPTLRSTSLVTVYAIGIAITTELPVYNIGGGYNVIFSQSGNIIQIYNAKTGGFYSYKIIVLNS